jgi:hypothetical protein
MEKRFCDNENLRIFALDLVKHEAGGQKVPSFIDDL